MGPLDNQPDENNKLGESGAEASLREIVEELEHIKRNLLLQLSQEIEQLQNRKTRLLAETEQLELQRQEQMVQQRELARQLAPLIVEQLQEIFRYRLQAQAQDGELVATGQLNSYNENAYRLISSLDTTLRTTFKTLQQDLSSYQSSLSQQLGQMYSLEQQGEAILDALVSRLKEELQGEANRLAAEPPPIIAPRAIATLTPPPPQTTPSDNHFPKNNNGNAPTLLQDQATEIQPPIITPPPTVTPPPKKIVAPSQIQLGFILVLLSSLALSFQNVVISIILNMSSLFGKIQTGGYISPGFGNSLLILFLRMVVVVPLMAVVAKMLYPSSWDDINRFLKSRDWIGFINVTACGFFLFISSAFIYMALGSLTPGVALTLFFIFPIVTVLLSWVFFGERPSLVRTLATLTVFIGVVLISMPSGGGTVKLSTLGITTAIASGVTFAFHVLLIQACTKKLHPVPFSVVNFVVILLFSALSLFIPLPEKMQVAVDPAMWNNILISSFVLGGLTLLSYLANNIGISYIGAARASIFGASGPALTSLLAWIIIGKPLLGMQLLGMIIVTAGVLGQNLERLLMKKPKT